MKIIHKESSELNCIIDQIDLVDIYRIFYPRAVKHAFFSTTYGNFSKIDHILGHKEIHNKYKKCK
jgi:hypothetical protein